MLRAAILAHQGGWDEVVLVTGPVLVFGGILALARRRALALAAAQDTEASSTEPGD